MNITALPSTTDDLILDALPPADLYRYSWTCTSIHRAVTRYIRRAFSIHKTLSQYFSEQKIVEFRRIQWGTGLIISGSTALQFFDRQVYEGSDLDIYVDHPYREDVALWLSESGYKYAPTSRFATATLEQAISGLVPQDSSLEYWDAVSLINFERQNPYRKIQLITTDGSPLSTVLNFHSTCVMNIITHNKAYALFPRATFDGVCKRTITTPSAAHHSYTQKALDKYAQRGWKIINAVFTDGRNGLHSFFPEGLRFVGDSACWTMSLSPEIDYYGVDHHIELNGWETTYDYLQRPSMEFCKVNPGSIFTHSFVCPPDDELIACINKLIAKAFNEYDRGTYRMEKYEKSYATLLGWYFYFHS